MKELELKKVLLLVILTVLVASCTGEFITDEGVVWQRFIFGEITHGVEQNDELIFYADDDNSVHAIYHRTQGIKFTRSFSNQIVDTIYSAGEELYIITHIEDAENSTLWAYHTDEGLLRDLVTLPLVPTGKYTTFTNNDDEHKLVVHSDTKIAIINLTNLQYEAKENLGGDKYIGHDGIGAIVYARVGPFNEKLLVVTKNSRVVKFDENHGSYLSDSNPDHYQSTGADFYGSAVYNDGYLYIGDSSGIQIMAVDNGQWPTGEDYEVMYPNLQLSADREYLYAALQDYPHAGLVKYEIDSSTGKLDEIWTYDTFGNVSYGSVMIHEFNGIGAVLDDEGNLYSIDLDDGSLIFQKQIGMINTPYLKAAVDDGEGIMFIPVNVPSKIVCYSFNWVFGYQQGQSEPEN